MTQDSSGCLEQNRAKYLSPFPSSFILLNSFFILYHEAL
jgi:hypothetical protein